MILNFSKREFLVFSSINTSALLIFVINKSSLLKIIELLKYPPKENDYSEDILGAIKNGSCTKCKIMSEVGIDEYTYEKFIQALKFKNMIKFEHKHWKIT